MNELQLAKQFKPVVEKLHTTLTELERVATECYEGDNDLLDLIALLNALVVTGLTLIFPETVIRFWVVDLESMVFALRVMDHGGFRLDDGPPRA